MKKSGLILFLMFFLLFSFVSCSKGENICYYGFFENTAIVVLYSAEKNELYEIKLPLNQIVEWGTVTGTNSVSTSMRTYVGLKEDGFMVGNSQVLVAVRDILNALSQNDDADVEDRLSVLTLRDDILGNLQLLKNMNKLCATDFSKLVNALKNKNAKVKYFDTSKFLPTDVIKAQSYFKRWLSQVI